MKALIALAFSISSTFAIACIPMPGTFVPSIRLMSENDQLGHKSGVFTKTNNVEIQQGYVAGIDQNVPTLMVKFDRAEKNNELVIISREVVGCNIEKITAKSKDLYRSIENDLVVELYDYSKAPCISVRGDMGFNIVKYGYGGLVFGSISGFGFHNDVYVIQRCL